MNTMPFITTMNGTIYQRNQTTKSASAFNKGIDWPPRDAHPPSRDAAKWLLDRYYDAATCLGQEGGRPISRAMVNRKRRVNIRGGVDFAGRAHRLQRAPDDASQGAEGDAAIEEASDRYLIGGVERGRRPRAFGERLARDAQGREAVEIGGLES